MTIKIAKFADKQVISPSDWKLLFSNTEKLLESLLLTAHYQENGWSSRYIIDGFSVSSIIINKKRKQTTMIIGQGMAVIEDKIISFPQNSSFELILDRVPKNGDVLCVTYQISESSYNQVEKRTVNDKTEIDSEEPIKTESEKSITPTLKEYLPKFEILNESEDYINEKIYIKMKYWQENETYIAGKDESIESVALLFSVSKDDITEYNNLQYPYSINEGDTLLIPIQEFITYRQDTNTTLKEHRNGFNHKDRSIRKIHLVKDIIGGHSSRDLTLDICSNETKELAGNFPIAQAGSRFDKIIGKSGGFLSNTPTGYGIDDVFLEKVREFLLNGKSGTSGPTQPGREWVSYQYNSSIKPCLGFETTEDGKTKFRWNPDALMGSIHAMQYAAKVDVVRKDENLDNMRVNMIFNGINSIPRQIQYNDINLNELFALNSLNTINFELIGNYNWIMIASVNKNVQQLNNNHVNAYSLAWVYDTFQDTILYPAYPVDNYFDTTEDPYGPGENYQTGNFQQDWFPEGKPNTGTTAILSIGSSNCFLIGKRIFYKRT